MPTEGELRARWEGGVDRKFVELFEKIDDQDARVEEHHAENRRLNIAMDEKLDQILAKYNWLLGFCAAISLVIGFFFHSIKDWILGLFPKGSA